MPAAARRSPRKTKPARRAAANRQRKATATRRKPDALALYRSKRAFDITPEPAGGKQAAVGGRSFVVQKHAASHLHYDFRLEHNGVLLSWAVPKGPSLVAKRKRLAVQTEHHPVAYGAFEGTIPDGQYGAGDVQVWDRGTWTPGIDPDAGLRKGHLAIELHGERLRGAFDLVRTRGGKAAQGPGSTWLLIKHDDQHALGADDPEITETHTGSVIEAAPRSRRRASKASPYRAAPAKKRAAAGTRKKAPSSRRRSTRSRASTVALDTIEPQLATAVDQPPSSGRWVYEVKFDGYRLLAAADGGDVRLRSRNQLDWTHTFPAITAALQALDLSGCVLDGELCFVQPDGTTSFQQLQRVLPRGGKKGGPAPAEQEHLVLYLFDLLAHDGEDLRTLPLAERKQRLRALLPKSPKSPLAYSDHVETDGRAAFTQACRAGLEGLIAKRADAPYVAGRSTHWLKLKCRQRQEFIVVGMAAPASEKRAGFRSLLLALRDEKTGALRYSGKVGTGFDATALKDLSARLKKIAVKQSPLADPPRERGVTWVRPELVAEIEYAEMTQDGSVRHGSFQGLRLDKSAARVTREKAKPVRNVVSRSSSSETRATTRKTPVATGTDGPVVALGVTISHPERVVDTPSQLTKGELARYHEQVSELLLPYAIDRPLALVRCPDGDASQCFFQKQKPRGTGRSVGHRRVGAHEVVFARDARGILELVQFNAIEFHGWGARAAHPKRPDWIVMDLDPDTSLAFAAVVEAALEMREALKSVGLESFVKVTGGKGLHVVAPFTPRAGWDEVKSFAHGIATAFAARAPERYVATMSKAKRAGRIFVDYLRNGEGATAVLPYSPRARPHAPVALPVAWRDLRHVAPDEFTVRETSTWLRKRRRDPWATFFEIEQELPSLS